MKEAVPILVCGLIVVGVIVGGGYLIHSDIQEEKRLMAQCLSDGHKEYECRAILNQGKSKSGPPVMFTIPILR